MGEYRKGQPTKWIVSTANNRLYGIWNGMRQRCTRANFPNYYNYGGRGIKICPEWENDFDAFYHWANSSGYEDNLTLDRVDNDKGYCPENCRWATVKEQSRNRKTNRFIEIDGKRRIVSDWANATGVPAVTICSRLNKGYSPREAVYGKRNRQYPLERKSG